MTRAPLQAQKNLGGSLLLTNQMTRPRPQSTRNRLAEKYRRSVEIR